MFKKNYISSKFCDLKINPKLGVGVVKICTTPDPTATPGKQPRLQDSKSNCDTTSLEAKYANSLEEKIAVCCGIAATFHLLVKRQKEDLITPRGKRHFKTPTSLRHFKTPTKVHTLKTNGMGYSDYKIQTWIKTKCKMALVYK